MISYTNNDQDFGDLKIIAATKVEDGESAEAVTEYLIQNKGADSSIAENIAKECYSSRQRHFRILGIIFLCIGGIILFASFIFQDFLNDLISEWNRWSAHRTGGLIHLIKIIFWLISLYLSVKGLIYLLLGGKGVKTKTPV